MPGMQRPELRLARPLYEALPWLYIAGGLAALGASYLLASYLFASLLVGVFGLASLVGGIAVVLRRREYRAFRSHYGNPDSYGSPDSLTGKDSEPRD